MDTIPLPPPFFHPRRCAAEAVDSYVASSSSSSDNGRDLSVMSVIERTAALVNGQAKVPMLSAVGRAVQVGLVADSDGYLLDAFLSRLGRPAGDVDGQPTPPPATVMLQALVALSKVSNDVARTACGRGARTEWRCLGRERRQGRVEAQFKVLTGHAWHDRAQPAQVHSSDRTQQSEWSEDSKRRKKEEKGKQIDEGMQAQKEVNDAGEMKEEKKNERKREW